MTILTPTGMNSSGQFLIMQPGDTLANVATVTNTGQYSDLIGSPVNVSFFTNDSGYITSAALASYVTSASLVTTLSSYALSSVLSGYVPIVTTINGKGLSSNITLSPSDIGSPAGAGNSTGTNTGDQTITLTGDVTGSGTGSFSATIGGNKVTYGKIQQTNSAVLLGNPSGIMANAGEITLGSGLSFSGTTLVSTGSGGTITALTGDVTASGSGSVASTISNNAVTTAKLNNAAVTYAKIQNESGSTILGNPTGSATSPSEITLGNGLAFSGTSLLALRTISALTLSLVGTGATGTQISSTKDSTVRLTVSTSTTSTIGGPSTSVVVLKICATNNATEASWTTVATLESDQTITLAIALQSIQIVKGQLCSDLPGGWFVKLVNSGTGTHAEAFISGQQTIYG